MSTNKNKTYGKSCMIPKKAGQTKFTVRLERNSDAVKLFTDLLKKFKNLDHQDTVFCSEETGKALRRLSDFHFQPIAKSRRDRYSVRMFKIAIRKDDTLDFGQFKVVIPTPAKVEEEELC